MKVQLPYGRSVCEVSLDDRLAVDVFAPHWLPELHSPLSYLRHVLGAPSGAAPLNLLARKAKSACVVVSDNTRPVPNEFLLPSILETLKNQVHEVLILVANGLHPPMSDAELEALVGARIYASYPVVNHDAYDLNECAFFGYTPHGIPLHVNRRFARADLRILTGLVEPHFMAGYSGGRKSVCPGLAAAGTIQGFHSPMLLESPCATTGVLTGNPIHEEACFAANRVGVDFIVNVGINQAGKLVAITAGGLFQAWSDCVSQVRQQSAIHVNREYDVVIAANAGHPLDRNFYQTVKGLVTAAAILREGGTIVMLSECADGLGTEAFRHCLELLRKARSMESFLSHISDVRFSVPEQWQVEKYLPVLRKSSRIRLFASGLTQSDAALAQTELSTSPEEAVKYAIRDHGPNARIAVVPDGPYTMPILRR